MERKYLRFNRDDSELSEKLNHEKNENINNLSLNSNYRTEFDPKNFPAVVKKLGGVGKSTTAKVYL